MSVSLASASLALSLGLLGDPIHFDLASGSDFQTRGGYRPIQPNESSVPNLELNLTLLSGLRAQNDRTRLNLRYLPQIYFQAPNVAALDRPLYLHRVRAEYASRLSRRWNFDWNATVTAGDLSYASITQNFDQGTASAGSSVVPITYIASSGAFAYRTGQRNTLSFSLGAGYRDTPTNDDQTPVAPTSYNLDLRLSDTYVVSLRDNLGFSLELVRVQREQDTIQNQTIPNNSGASFQSSWTRNFNAISSLELNAGAGLSWVDGSKQWSFFPLANASYSNEARFWENNWTSVISGGARAFFDPLLATYRPQSFLAYRLAGQHGRKWSSNTNLQVAVPLNSEALVPVQYESSAQLLMSASYLAFPGVSFTAGLRTGLRAAHWQDFDALKPQGEMTGFVGLRCTTGTDGQQGGWL